MLKKSFLEYLLAKYRLSMFASILACRLVSNMDNEAISPSQSENIFLNISKNLIIKFLQTKKRTVNLQHFL